MSMSVAPLVTLLRNLAHHVRPNTSVATHSRRFVQSSTTTQPDEERDSNRNKLSCQDLSSLPRAPFKLNVRRALTDNENEVSNH